MLVRQGNVVREVREWRDTGVSCRGTGCCGRGRRETHSPGARDGRELNIGRSVRVDGAAARAGPKRRRNARKKDTKGRTVGGALGSNTGAPAPYSSWPAVEADVPEGADRGGGDHLDHWAVLSGAGASLHRPSAYATLWRRHPL